MGLDRIVGWQALATHPFAYPVLEALHILGIACLVGSLLMLELRVWGLGASLPVAALARLALAMTVAGFAVVLLTGLLMFSTAPQELLGNRTFVVKLGLIGLAGLNAALFHARGGLQRLDAWARVQTALSLLLWVAVVFCGRWIGYA